MDQYHEVIEGKVRRGSGAKKVKNRDKRLAHVGGSHVKTKIGEKQVVERKRGRGGTVKYRLKYAVYVNVSDGKGNVKKVKIQRVVVSNNPDFTRQGIITKGSIVQTELGKVKITSRPGQHGVLNGVLVKESNE